MTGNLDVQRSMHARCQVSFNLGHPLAPNLQPCGCLPGCTSVFSMIYSMMEQKQKISQPVVCTLLTFKVGKKVFAEQEIDVDTAILHYTPYYTTRKEASQCLIMQGTSKHMQLLVLARFYSFIVTFIACWLKDLTRCILGFDCLHLLAPKHDHICS